MSASGVDGTVFTPAELLDRVHAEGAFLIRRGAAERLRGTGWAADLASDARKRGMHVSIREMGAYAIVFEVTQAGVAEPANTAGAAAEARSAESRERHPSHGPRLRVIPGGLDR